ncbi:hypothetical protein T439DRAFT_326722 [Meredithblackwellia eburnea MCA 4105]
MLDGDAPQISVVAGVTVGLLASFVQSLGLTIQRKSHLQNEALPSSLRKRDFKRPLWVTGFVIFLCSNLLGTIFQIGALPIVVLGPLGAVSLLYNAFFARIILGDEFSVHLVLGTILIAGGAVLIGMFGVVPETTHTLDELVELYSRPAFIIWISLLSTSLLVVVVLAHITEWAFERQVLKADPVTPTRPFNPWRRRSRKDSHPPSRPGTNHTQSSPNPNVGTPSQRYGAFEETVVARHARSSPGLTISTPLPIQPNGRATSPSNFGAPPSPIARAKLQITTPDPEMGGFDNESKPALSAAAVERTKIILGVAYGGASGTLSGLCLLFAKTGIELLILTVVGQNQFGHYQAWLIVAVLLIAAILQLFYLNRALRLVGPTLICPLAFCFYNLSSMISGLIYYDQWDMLTNLQFGLVSLGTAILLAGVWIVSIRNDTKDEAKVVTGQRGSFGAGPLTDEPESDGEDSDASSMQGPVEWIPRGLTIGIGAASPGFDIRPTTPRRHIRTATLPSASFPPLFDEREVQNDHSRLMQRTASEADAVDDATGEMLARKRRARQRGFSMSGGLFVGTGRVRGHQVPSAPGSPLAPPATEA